MDRCWRNSYIHSRYSHRRGFWYDERVVDRIGSLWVILPTFYPICHDFPRFPVPSLSSLESLRRPLRVKGWVSVSSPSFPALQKLHRLNVVSPGFQDCTLRGGGLEGDDMTSLVGYLDKVCLRFVFPDSSLVSILSALLPGRIQEHMRHYGDTLNIVHTSASFPKHRFLPVCLRRLWLCV